MTFNKENLPALLDEEIARAIERMRNAIADLQQDIRDLEKEQARRQQRKKESTSNER